MPSAVPVSTRSPARDLLRKPPKVPGTWPWLTAGSPATAGFRRKTLLGGGGRGSDWVPPSRIRKGFPCEARVVARILPQFLDDFFPPQDVMNKVIGEFLSNQQPYPQFMATVVYKVRAGRGLPTRTGRLGVQRCGPVAGHRPGPSRRKCCVSAPGIWASPPPQVFQTLHSTGQSSMVRDWVMLSLSNFTQRTPVAMAVWSLSCFFVSASTGPWVSAMYPSRCWARRGPCCQRGTCAVLVFKPQLSR